MTTRLLELEAGDDPAAWARLGFHVGPTGACRIGDVTVRLDGGGGGLRGWVLGGGGHGDAVDGIATSWSRPDETAPAPQHPNGAAAIDHIVVLTDSRDRTTDALVSAGGDLRRRVDPPALRTAIAFVRLESTIIEVAEAPGIVGAGLWGLVAVVPDVELLAGKLGDAIGHPRDAVQPGRRIVTATMLPGLETALAFITPRP